MPYVNAQTKELLDPEITAALATLFDKTTITKRNAKVYFFRLLVLIFEAAHRRIEIWNNATPRYRDHAALIGTDSCAYFELMRRWSERCELKLRFPNVKDFLAEAEAKVAQGHELLMIALAERIVMRITFSATSGLQKTIDKLIAEEKRAMPQQVEQLICDALRNFANTFSKEAAPLSVLMVGDLNYTISEIANTFEGYTGVRPQALLDAAVAAVLYAYGAHTGPYEDKAILKNGDTAGFLAFLDRHKNEIAANERQLDSNAKEV